MLKNLIHVGSQSPEHIKRSIKHPKMSAHEQDVSKYVFLWDLGAKSKLAHIDFDRMANGMGKGLSKGNLNNVPNENNGSSVDRFSLSSAAEEPYFARARMEGRSEHMSQLTNQLDATDELLKK